MSLAGKWGISSDEETYRGEYDTREAAIADCNPGDDRWVGQYVEPDDPAGYLNDDLLLEHITCQDEYSMECAEDAFDCTEEDRKDLTERLQGMFRQWMTDRGVTPGFYLVDPETVEKAKFDSDGNSTNNF